MLTLVLLPNINIICEITARVKTLNRQEEFYLCNSHNTIITNNTIPF